MTRTSLGAFLQRARRALAGPEEGSDQHLLEQFRATGDGEAFAELVRRHGPMVQAVASRTLTDPQAVDDVCQATFIVLARKPGAVRAGEPLAGWLFGVALRLAQRSRSDAARRRDREGRAAAMRPTETTPDVWEDLRPILDEEIGQLPEKYRLTVVLRYLQGKSTEEAARELGWPTGSLTWRLSKALDLLRERLTKRGITLAGATLAALLGECAAPAANPIFVQNVTAVAIAAATGKTLAEVGALAPAAQLANGVIGSMNRFKFLTMLLLIVPLAAGSLGVGWLGWQAWATPGPSLDPTGKPVKGLRLTLTATPDETTLGSNGETPRPVNLSATFTNNSDQSVRLNTHDLWFEHCRLSAQGPDGKNVPVKQALVDRLSYAPQERDFIVLAPGKTWVSQQTTPFPGFFAAELFEVSRPGDYRLKVTYRNAVGTDGQLGVGAWTGEVVSNEVVVKVDAPPVGSAPINGLKMTLTAERSETTMKPDGSDAEQVKLTLKFTNVSDKAIKFLPANSAYASFAMSVTTNDPAVVNVEQTHPKIELAPLMDRDFITLKPGEDWVHEQSLPGKFATMHAGKGYTHEIYAFRKPGEVRVKFAYGFDHGKDWPGAWTGGVASNVVAINVQAPKAEAVPVDGLEITLTADRKETTLKADGSNVEPVKFTARLKNVSKNAIKICTYQAMAKRDIWADAPADMLFSVHANKEIQLRAVQAGDFITLEPGKEWETTESWPGSYYFNTAERFICKSGVCKVRYFYELVPINPGRVEAPLFNGAWTGKAFSNQLEIKVNDPPGGVAKDTMNVRRAVELGREAAAKVLAEEYARLLKVNVRLPKEFRPDLTEAPSITVAGGGWRIDWGNHQDGKFIWRLRLEVNSDGTTSVGDVAIRAASEDDGVLKPAGR